MDSVDQDFENSVQFISRKKLHELVRNSSKRLFDEKLKDLDEKLLSIAKFPPEKASEFKSAIKSFKKVYKRKWLASHSTEHRFLEKNQDWLNEEIPLPALLPCKKGRPNKEFSELSERSKRRQTMDLRKNIPVDKLTYATQMSCRASGNTQAATLIQEITKSPTRAAKIRKSAEGVKTNTKKHTPEEALTIFVEANLTFSQYEVIQQANRDVYPCYTYLQKAKQACYPKKNVGETYAEIKLQDLVNHTTVRLFKYLESVYENIQCQDKEFLLIFKWGCDGSQQSQYKQKFENEEDSDGSIFLSSLVPLRLTHGDKTIWQNPHPSSPRYCRPIRMRFVKETTDITNEEIDNIESQARDLQPTKVDENIKVKHLLLPTMVDGKVCNAATNTTSTLRCYICGKTSKNFNDLSQPNTENPETFKFGLSILHARIRFFEFLIHLAYKIKAGVCKGRVTLKSDKDKIDDAKKDMIKEFRVKMGLLVDIPKAGFGNTNDGNTSRRFFNDPEEAANVTGLELNLIKRFKIILEVLSCGFDINHEKFSIYTMETAKYYIDNYQWQPMSPTVHKILIHSASVIKHALLPIGQLSEEAAEARNKHFRQYREGFARKFTRTQCNEDIMNRLLLTSDPYISSLRPKGKSKKQAFSREALDFLKVEDECL